MGGGGRSIRRDEGREDVGREEVQAEGEVRGGENGKGFREDVGDGFVAEEVRVELVSGFSRKEMRCLVSGGAALQAFAQGFR